VKSTAIAGFSPSLTPQFLFKTCWFVLVRYCFALGKENQLPVAASKAKTVFQFKSRFPCKQLPTSDLRVADKLGTGGRSFKSGKFGRAID
jgi:hypothetical protein